ncbi:N-glycosylase/DNA lyase-like isoform X2 [Rhopilema esculentum]|uniref:N-glycosylase/DNA lyase-like isoform X2 n=1 Tax=Rhopilema esculentum TaxID=499914 RepID=UPI0031DC141A
MSVSELCWKSFSCPKALLNLDIVLACGQCFRWSKNDDGEWNGVIGKRVWFLKQTSEQIFYKSFGKRTDVLPFHIEKREEHDLTSSKQQETSVGQEDVLNNDLEEAILRDYFQLDVDLERLYKSWSKNDEVFNRLANNFGGLRMLRQDPVENLFSFICSQNNHISRISSMVEKLCSNYGDNIGELEGKAYHSFPSLAALSNESVEQKLRELSFGYRAKFIYQCAKKILETGKEGWLHHLRAVDYKEAHSALCQLPGVGAKVADCVCLMSLDKTEAVPVDTHMWQIAQRDYLPHLKKYKSLTDKIYEEIGDHFRGIYGEYAGWAHSVLFSADLRRFRDLKMDALKSKPGPEKQQQKKQAKRQKRKVKADVIVNDLQKQQDTSKKGISNVTQNILKRRSQRISQDAGGKQRKI